MRVYNSNVFEIETNKAVVWNVFKYYDLKPVRNEISFVGRRLNTAYSNKVQLDRGLLQ